jgi:TetR/AcrR family transcriptional regulator, cholesterol catabolism regulator
MEEKRDAYIKESLKLFLKHGVKRVTVGQLTKQLNISSKTLYVLFGDKNGLVKACFELYKANSRRAYLGLQGESENVAELMVRFYHMLVEALSRMNPHFFADIARYFPAVWDNDEAFSQHQSRELIERGVAEGIFVAHLDPEICAETLTMLLSSMFTRERLNGTSTDHLLTNVIWPYVRGLCTAAGLAEFRKYRHQLE